MSIPTATSRAGRPMVQFPDRPAQLVRGDPKHPPDPGSPKDPHGPHDPGPTISDLQWLLAWLALGLVLWLLARTAVGYRLIYYGVVLLILLLLVTQYKWVQAIFAPFAALRPGLVTGGKATKTNQAAADTRASKNGPRSAPRSTAAAAGTAGHTAETAGTLAALG